MLTRKSADLPLVGILTIAALGIVLLGLDQPFLRVAITLPFAFILPGYAVIAALFPRQRLLFAARLLLAVALSLSLAGISGLFLQVTHLGLDPFSWVIVLSLITVFGSATAWLRRPARAGVERTPVNLKLGHIIMMAAACVLVVVALQIAQDGVRSQPRPGFTQLWLLPVEGQDFAVQLGIRNEERQTLIYRLVVQVGDEIAGEWDGIALSPGETWVTSALVPDTDQTVEALLYRRDAPDQLYRSVHLSRGSLGSP